jgi:hypothetical protein
MMYKGWTVEHCLKMPATRFFAMLKAGRRIQCLDRIEDIDIAMAPGCGPKYFEVTRRRFEKRLEHYADLVPAVAEAASPIIPKTAPGVVLDAGSQEAKDFMMTIFAAKKGQMV